MGTLTQSRIKKMADHITKILVALLTAGLLGVGNHLLKVPSVDEVRDMIQREAPYVHDRRVINEYMRRSTEINAKLGDSINNLNIQLAGIRAELKLTRERVNEGK